MKFFRPLLYSFFFFLKHFIFTFNFMAIQKLTFSTLELLLVYKKNTISRVVFGLQKKSTNYCNFSSHCSWKISSFFMLCVCHNISFFFFEIKNRFYLYKKIKVEEEFCANSKNKRKKNCDLFSIFAANADFKRTGKSARIKIELSSTTTAKRF